MFTKDVIVARLDLAPTGYGVESKLDLAEEAAHQRQWYSGRMEKAYQLIPDIRVPLTSRFHVHEFHWHKGSQWFRKEQTTDSQWAVRRSKRDGLKIEKVTKNGDLNSANSYTTSYNLQQLGDYSESLRSW